MFTSTISSVSILDHAVSAFGFQAAHDAVVECNSWGDVITINHGDSAGTYDIHSFKGEVKFIAV